MASNGCRGDASLSPRGYSDLSRSAPSERRCLWCGGPLQGRAERNCSKRCRQAAWRARKLDTLERAGGEPARLVYADPPYPGMAKRYYGDQPSFAGEVDHEQLIAQLVTYDGWALSTSEKALRGVLLLCPPEARVGAWHKTHGTSTRTRGTHNVWEPLIYVPARRRRPGVRDSLVTPIARGGGQDLMGRKPLAFVAWMFALLGADPSVDSFDDLFPGTGVCSSSWRQMQQGAA